MNEKTRSGGDAVVRAFNLRDVQTEAIHAVQQHFRSGERRGLLVLPTGVGKTITALEMVRRAVANGKRCGWFAHRRELVTQPHATLEAIEHFADLAAVSGFVYEDSGDYGARLVFSSIQTMGTDARMAAMAEAGPFDLVVFDEAHHLVDGRAWGRTALQLIGAEEDGAGGCYVVGLTATPERADGVALASMWGDLPAFAYSMQQAIDSGYLLPPVFYDEHLPMSEELAEAIEEANRDGADDVDRDTARRLLDEGLVGHTVAVMQKHDRGEGRRHMLVFCASVEQVDLTHDALRALGWRSATITAKTPKRQRAEALRLFALGELDTIVNCGTLTEGTDLPVCDQIVLSRPCGSKSLYIQIVGRGARTYPGQESFDVIDTLGAHKRHTLVSSVALDIGTEAQRGRKWRSKADQAGPGWSAPERSVWWATLRPVGADGIEWLELHNPAEPRGGNPAGCMSGEGPVYVEFSPSLWTLSKSEGGGSAPVMDPFGKRGSGWQPAWVDCGDGIMGLSIGDHGSVFIVPNGDGLWWPVRVVKGGRKARPIQGRPAPHEIASSMVVEIARQAEKLARVDAEWRRGPMSDKQRDFLKQLGIKADERWTKGEAAHAITEHQLRGRVQRLGLRAGWTPGGDR